MTKLLNRPATAAMVTLFGVCASTGAAIAQDVPADGAALFGIADRQEIRDILTNADLQDDPAVQAKIAQLRDRLAANALSASEAEDLYLDITTSKGPRP